MPIAYALASDHPDRVDRIAVSESLMPGVSASPPLFVPPLANARLWHLMFNQLPGEVNEALVRGRENIFFGAEFDASAGTTKLPDEVVKYYVDVLASDPDALRGSFGFYRAVGVTRTQNEERKARRLTIRPRHRRSGSAGDGSRAMQLVADDVQTVVLRAPATGSPSKLPRRLLDA